MLIEFRSKAPHNTAFLAVQGPVAEIEASPALAELRKVGWKDEPNRAPDRNGEREITMSRAGTDLFNSWLPGEKTRFMAEARAVLRRHGLTAKWRKLTLRDLL